MSLAFSVKNTQTGYVHKILSEEGMNVSDLLGYVSLMHAFKMRLNF